MTSPAPAGPSGGDGPATPAEAQSSPPLLDLFRRRLRVKVITLIVAVLIVGFGVLVTLNIQREARALVDRHQESARLLAGSILAAIENGMLEGRPDIIRQLVQGLQTELKDVRRIDVYRRNGVEAFTDMETVNEVNRIAGLEQSLIDRIAKMRREPGTRISHPLFTRAVQTIEPQETEEGLDGARVLTLFRPLRNLDKCQECHGTDHQVRGVVRVSLGLDKLEGELRAARMRQVTVAGLTILGVAVCLVVSMGRLVLKPIARVSAAARRIGAGDFDTRVEAPSTDEIGDLGRVINDMAGHLRTARAELEARNAELATALQNLKESMQKVELLEQLKGELVKFVPEAVTRLLEQNPDARELEKREADVSVLFLDVEGYTRLSEQLPPQRLNRMIQDYFGNFLEIIRAHHGDVNETAGDGLMVIFQSEGSPTRHALNAAGTAFELLARVAQLNQEFAGIYPPVAIHVGINSGPALVGATKIDAAGGGRWTFTATGPTTNLAARVAGLTKGGEVKVGPETAERIKGHYVLEDTGEHQLKNVSRPVRVYRLVPAGVYTSVQI
ncbi:MAG TPA: adenylate/guanylate cyclase domain-containing protein [Methylomirabilota bacterium]|nr:adenylate/guanylate cyclase domain-containing protein [Methylomirabilota bacterium]